MSKDLLFGKWGSQILNLTPGMDQIHKGTFIFAFGMKKNGLLGPKMGLSSFLKKSEKNVTPHYFGYNLVKFCTIVKCYTISESWDVDYSSGAKKKFQIFLTNEKQALETWPSRVL